jgi:hypothetical protein
MKAPPLPKLPPLSLDDFTLDLNYYFTKEYTEIGEASIELPAIIEWLNYQHQGQIELKCRKKAELARAESDAYFDLKNGGFQRLGLGDKATDSALTHAICKDERVTQITEELAVTTGYVERLYNLQRSLQFKLELVRSTETTRRSLIDTQ